jgi:hypothetical protein
LCFSYLFTFESGVVLTQSQIISQPMFLSPKSEHLRFENTVKALQLV